MAYRTFWQPTESREVDYSPIYSGVTRLFQGIAEERNKRSSAADQFKYALKNGHFENDNKINSEFVKAVNQRAVEEIRRTGSISADTRSVMIQGEQNVADQEAQYKKWQELDQQVTQRGGEDPYYDPNIDKQKLNDAVFGRDGQQNFYHRDKALEEARQTIGVDPRAFRAKKYTADWVKLYGEDQKKKVTENPYAKTIYDTTSPFWDDNGKPGVTDRHAVEYIKSDERVDSYYDWKLDAQLDEEVAKLKASKDPRTSWMKGLSDLEIKNELVNDPSKNLINSQNYGIRKREMAKVDLADAAKIQQTVDVTTKTDSSKTGGLYKNDAISYNPTFLETRSNTEGVDPNISAGMGTQFSSPGAQLVISKGATVGKDIKMDIDDGKNVFNIHSGRTGESGLGKRPFNLKGYQLQVYQKNGKPFPIAAKNTDELISKLNQMKDSEFKNLDPEPSVALNGYTLDRSALINEASARVSKLNREIANATETSDFQKKKSLEAQLESLEYLTDIINDDDSSDKSIMDYAARNGITGNRTDVIVKAKRSDLDWIGQTTEGLNLNSKGKWSEDMRRFNEAYTERYKKAAANGFAGGTGHEEFKPAKVGGVKKKGPVKAASQADVDKLPSGTVFIWTDGNEYQKE